MLIKWLPNTDCVDTSALQRAVLYNHLQIVNYGDLKCLFGSKQMTKRTNWDKTGFNIKMTLNEHSLPIKRV